MDLAHRALQRQDQPRGASSPPPTARASRRRSRVPSPREAHPPKGVGQKASGTTAPQNVEDCVQNSAQWPEVRPTPTAPVVEEGFDECPLFIDEVAGVDVAALL